MSASEEKRLLIKVAHMYYELDMTQGEIAKELGIYRTTISRMLKKAKQEGIVQIHIETSGYETFELEKRLEKAFQLKEVIIVPAVESQTDTGRKKALGHAAYDLLNRIIKDKDIIGFAWGTTLSSMVGRSAEYKTKAADFVPLVGGPGTMDNKYHVNTIVYNVANAFGGSAHFIDAAAVVEKKETRDDIVGSKYFQKILQMWEKINIAVVGIGAPLSSSNLIWTGFFGDKEIKELNTLNAIGDICSRFYDIDGNIIHSEITDRTIAIELTKLQQLDYSIAVAESIDKVPSIVGALRGRFVNVLITDDITANELVKYV
ncbi:DNA-binding transcriptional regulator LsrR, DeoR family [Evansella caseinilytica]|uniref:DNA-binding transcriptional regulator LsrR, DeoR family n=1 Tax=Evansella caseinilytica TaxID=1503961 RepID=A0A1H3H8A5_9BACI|nr:sugar-binding transcriptional regulator [Evansella caseinilytica]SDY11455.1 DNA-binding transcriptional regulator LsrR, DeoR family [Evansella caseinilytica]